MNRYQSIKQLAVLSAALLEQVRFSQQIADPQETERLLKEIIAAALCASEDSQQLKRQLWP